MTLICQHRPASSALGCLLSGVLLSVGLVLCLFNSWATECSLGECSLYSGAMVFGASLFAWGAVTFGLLICFSGRSSTVHAANVCLWPGCWSQMPL